MNKRIKSLVMLVPFAAGLISGDAVFASSSLEKSKMFIGRGKKNLADAVDKNDVNCDEELSLSGNKTENKIKDISDKNTQASRFGLLGFLGINGAAVGIGTAGFGIKKLVKILQKHRHRGMEKDEENLKEQRKENSNLPSNPKPDSGQVNPTTVKEKPYGDISLWIKENPTVFSLVVISFTVFLVVCVLIYVSTRRAIKKLNEEIDKEIEYVGNFIRDKRYKGFLKDFKNYKAILEQIINGNTDKTLTLILSNNNNISDSEDIYSRMRVFYTLAGRFYDTLGGFWCAASDENKIKEGLKKNDDVDMSVVYPKNESKV